MGGHEWQGPATVLRTVMPDLATYSTLSHHPLFHPLWRPLGHLATFCTLVSFREACLQSPECPTGP